MSFEALHAVELSWLQALQPYRLEPINIFFKFLNIFDRIEFFLVLITVVWSFYSPKWALRLFYLSIASSLINSTFKTLFHQPRPVHLDPTLGLFSFSSYGFPSGAAQSAVLLPYILIKEWKSKWAFFIGAIFFFLLSLSRVYLGVHFPSDLLGGWAIGLLLAIAFYRLYPWIEKKLAEVDPELSLLISIALLTFFLIFTPSETAFYTCYVALGSFCALFLATKHLKLAWSIAEKNSQRLFQALFALFFLMGVHVLFSFILIPAFLGHQVLLKSLSAFLIGFSPIYLMAFFQEKAKACM